MTTLPFSFHFILATVLLCGWKYCANTELYQRRKPWRKYEPPSHSQNSKQKEWTFTFPQENLFIIFAIHHIPFQWEVKNVIKGESHRKENATQWFLITIFIFL